MEEQTKRLAPFSAPASRARLPDRETAQMGYGLPFLIAAWVARYVPRGAEPLLDAGCGSGLSGPFLKALGYDDVDGVDEAAEPLALARERGVYRRLEQTRLDGPLPWPDRHFAAFLATGIFVAPDARAAGLDELVRVTKKGGHAIFTVRNDRVVVGGFRTRFAALAKARRWTPMEESPAFDALAPTGPEVVVKAFVFRIA